MSCPRSFRTGLSFAAAAVLVLVPVAVGHGPPNGGVGYGYVSTVDGLRPHLLGVLVRVLGGDDRLRLANVSGKTVVVEGYEHEPFLRFSPDGVYANLRSPATYLSQERDPALARVPASADPTATPRWRKVSAATTFEWHDRRIRWPAHEPPPAVQATPDQVHLVFRWRVPATADGKRFAVTGYLGYVPPPSEPGGGTSNWLVAGAAATAAAVLITAGLGARRARRRTP